MIPFSPPKIDQSIIEEVIDTLNSGWITTGPKTKKFERELEKFCGNSRTLCVSSGTHGLELILRWFGVGKGDEVILPAYTYSATANCVIHTGATPVMVDTNKEDFNLSVEDISKKITEKTKVIMPVDIGGMPCNYNEINELVKSSEVRKKFQSKNEIQEKLGRILVLSDSAHSLGAVYHNKNTGQLADISVFSFHAVKNLTTAEGGAIALNLPKDFNADEVYDFLNVFSLHGQTKDALAKMKNKGWKYDIIMPGYKANMTDIQASLGLVEIKRYRNDTLEKRRDIFNYYYDRLKDFDWAENPVYEKNDIFSSYHVYMMRIKGATEEKRDQFISKMYEKGVSVNVHFVPLPMLSYYKKEGFNIRDYPNAYQKFRNELSLPVYYDLSVSNRKTVVDKLVETAKELGF